MSNFDTLDETTSRNDNDFVVLRQGSSDYKQRRSVLEEGIRAFASNEANQARTDARSYADTQDAATLNSAESDASSKANQALADAKTNTTEQLQAHTAEADPHTQYLQKSDGLTYSKVSLPDGNYFARLCRLTNRDSSGSSSALFILTGGGDYGSTRRDDLLIRVTCRGSDFYGMCIALHARSNNDGFRLWYVVNDSTIDVWVSQAGYKTPYSFIPLETRFITIDTQTILASSDESLPELTEIPIYTSWDAYNLPIPTQAQAEDSSSTTPYAWTPQRVAQVASNQSGGLGINQRWQLAELSDTGATFDDGTASYRALNVEYTNTLDYPISVAMASQYVDGNPEVHLYVDGVEIPTTYGNWNNHGRTGATAIIPSGGSYRFTSSYPLGEWSELR